MSEQDLEGEQGRWETVKTGTGLGGIIFDDNAGEIARRLPGGLFFTAAAVLLAVQGEPDAITLLAVLGAAMCAAAALTSWHMWAMVGGTGLISLSLAMQILLKYWCVSCLRADMLILAAIVGLAWAQRGKVRLPACVMTGMVAVILLGAMVMTVPVTSDTALNNYEYSEEDISDTVYALAQKSPVLLFSPGCGACAEMMEQVIARDPVGESWLAVQSGGFPEEGRVYLDAKGYQGTELIYSNEVLPVPSLLTVEDGKPVLTYGTENVLKRLGLEV